MKSLSLSSPHIIATVGIPGSGKTRFAERFSETFAAPILECGRFVSAGASQGEAQKLTEHLLGQLMKTKQTIVLDGATDKRVERADLTRMARENGYRVLFVWVQTDQNIAKQRATKKGSADEYDQSIKKFSPPHDSENYVVISGHHNYSAQAKALLKRLTQNSSSPQTVSRTNLVPSRQTISQARQS